MAISLKELKSKKATLPPRILLYSPPGLGKTSMAADFPNAIFLQTEDGTPGDKEITSISGDNILSTYDEVVEAIMQLASEDHGFTTVVIDTLDKLEALVWQKVCDDNKWKTLEDPGFGKGYVMTDRYWRYILDGLANLRITRNMTILLLAHSTIERFDSPTSSPYNRYDIRLHKRALAMVQDDVDAILFINQDVTVKAEEVGFNREVKHAEGGGTRWLHAVGRPAFTAKNRYGIPDKLIYRPNEGYAIVGQYLPAQYEQIKAA